MIVILSRVKWNLKTDATYSSLTATDVEHLKILTDYLHFFFSEPFVQLIYLFFIGWFFLMFTFQVLYRFQVFFPSQTSTGLPWSRLSLQSVDCFLFNYMKSMCQLLKLFPELLEFLSSFLKMISLGEVLDLRCCIRKYRNKWILLMYLTMAQIPQSIWPFEVFVFMLRACALAGNLTSHWALTALQHLHGISIPRTEPLDFCFPPLVWSSVI